MPVSPRIPETETINIVNISSLITYFLLACGISKEEKYTAAV
jgi:hypothetical protein